MEDRILDEIRLEVKRLTPHNGTHGFDHTLRVYKTCMRIGFSTGADLSVLLPAALLHDVAREEAEHNNASSVKAREILMSLNYPREKMELVARAISTHSFSGRLTPDSLEAEILSDADKLDAMGALGVYRAAMYSGEKGRPIEEFTAHFYEKLLKLKEKLYTDEAKRIADSKHRFMLSFLEQLGKELSLDSQV